MEKLKIHGWIDGCMDGWLDIQTLLETSEGSL